MGPQVSVITQFYFAPLQFLWIVKDLQDRSLASKNFRLHKTLMCEIERKKMRGREGSSGLQDPWGMKGTCLHCAVNCWPWYWNMTRHFPWCLPPTGFLDGINKHRNWKHLLFLLWMFFVHTPVGFTGSRHSGSVPMSIFATSYKSAFPACQLVPYPPSFIFIHSLHIYAMCSFTHSSVEMSVSRDEGFYFAHCFILNT